MATAKYDTAGNIINAVAKVLKLGTETDPFSSNDENFSQLCQLLSDLDQTMAKAHQWEQLVLPYTFNTVNGQAEYDLPGTPAGADFNGLVPQSGWNLTTLRPLVGGITEQVYQYLQATSNGALLLNVAFRLNQGKMVLTPTPTAAESISFRYRSRPWVKRSGQALPDEDDVSAASDVVMFDVSLVKAALKLSWLGENGGDTQKAQTEFDTLWEQETNVMTDGPRLSLTSNDDMKYLDEMNVPDTGFGS